MAHADGQTMSRLIKAMLEILQDLDIQVSPYCTTCGVDLTVAEQETNFETCDICQALFDEGHDEGLI